MRLLLFLLLKAAPFLLLPLPSVVGAAAEFAEFVGAEFEEFAAADERLNFVSSTLGSNMVLQRGKPAVVWGFASRPGAVVEVSLNSQHFTFDGFAFAYFTVLTLKPTSGPTLGGTQMLVGGQNLQFGDEYECRFGEGYTTSAELVFVGNEHKVSCIIPRLRVNPSADCSRIVNS